MGSYIKEQSKEDVDKDRKLVCSDKNSQPDLCVEILERLREAVGKKTNERGASALFLHRDNVLPRWALSVSSLRHRMVLDLNQTLSPLSHLILHPVTCGSFKIRSTLKRPRFLEMEDGQQNVMSMLKMIPSSINISNSGDITGQV